MIFHLLNYDSRIVNNLYKGKDLLPEERAVTTLLVGGHGTPSEIISADLKSVYKYYLSYETVKKNLYSTIDKRGIALTYLGHIPSEYSAKYLAFTITKEQLDMMDHLDKLYKESQILRCMGHTVEAQHKLIEILNETIRLSQKYQSFTDKKRIVSIRFLAITELLETLIEICPKHKIQRYANPYLKEIENEDRQEYIKDNRYLYELANQLRAEVNYVAGDMAMRIQHRKNTKNELQNDNVSSLNLRNLLLALMIKEIKERPQRNEHDIKQVIETQQPILKKINTLMELSRDHTLKAFMLEGIAYNYILANVPEKIEKDSIFKDYSRLNLIGKRSAFDEAKVIRTICLYRIMKETVSYDDLLVAITQLKQWGYNRQAKRIISKLENASKSDYRDYAYKLKEKYYAKSWWNQ